MPRGHDLKTSAGIRMSPLIRHQGRSDGPEGRESRFGPSTAFIVTAEDMAELASEHPDQAKVEIVQKLHATCASRVFGFLRKSVSPDIADDLTQETFLKLLQVKNLERKSISISYLFRIAQNLLRRRFNVSKRRREIMEKVALFETPVHEHSSTGPVGIEGAMLDEALESLTQNEQETIRLIICDGLSYSQAAGVLNVPVSTINNWKHRALHKLRGTIDAADSQRTGQHSRPSHARSDRTRSSREHATGSQGAPGAREQAGAASEVRSETGTSRIRFAG